MLIVQRIQTRWTKLSRGGKLAALRNSTPHGISLADIPVQHEACMFHEIEFDECNNFRPETVARFEKPTSHFQIEPVFFHVTQTHCELRFNWSWAHCGAPERESYSLFKLAPGQWGQFICNGRFGPQTMSGDEWRYQQTVFNVGYKTSPNCRLFVDNEPDARGSSLAILK